MARNKAISDEKVIELINTYFYVECKKDVKKLKLTDIAAYIAANGYPSYKVTTLRRTQAARDYIESLMTTAKETSTVSVSAYKTLDVDAFIDLHRTKERLRKGLSDLDNYYHTIADSATIAFEMLNQYKDKIKRLEDDKEKLIKSEKDLMEQVAVLKDGLKEAEKERDRLREYIKTYTYPDIANKILMMDHLLKDENNSIDPSKLDENLIRSDTVIDFRSASRHTTKSAAIENLLKELDD